MRQTPRFHPPISVSSLFWCCYSKICKIFFPKKEWDRRLCKMSHHKINHHNFLAPTVSQLGEKKLEKYRLLEIWTFSKTLSLLETKKSNDLRF